MIAASPVHMVNAYKINYDYFKVSATRRIAQSTKQSAQLLLSDSPLSVLNQRVAVSSKPDKLKAEVKSGSAIQSFRVKISALASEQQNVGISSSKAAASPVQSGWNEFSLKQDGETTSIQVFIVAGETHEQTLGKIKAALNGRISGIQAAIVEDGRGKSLLKISSSHTGSKHAFALQDISGNAVTALGLNQKERSASNAAYSVGGGALQSSESNDIQLDKGNVKLSLLKTDSEEISVTTQADNDAIAAPIKQLVREYNQFQQHLHSAPGYLNRSLVQSLEHAAKPHTLEQLGLTEKADGTLSFNEAEFKQQVTDHYSDMKKSLIGVGGLASSLSRSFGRLDQMPSQALLNLDGSSLKSYSLYQSQMQTYLPLPMNGLLLDRAM
jgi:flagellar hook-associated protein 2